MPLINGKEVMKLLDVKSSTALQVIRELNAELKEQGYRTIRGKVEKAYLIERYNLSEADGTGTED